MNLEGTQGSISCSIFCSIWFSILGGISFSKPLQTLSSEGRTSSKAAKQAAVAASAKQGQEARRAT